MINYIWACIVSEDKTRVTVNASIEFNGSRRSKIKFHTSDVIEWLKKHNNIEVVNVLSSATLSNANLEQLKAEWVFEIKNKSKQKISEERQEELKESVDKIENNVSFQEFNREKKTKKKVFV